MPFLWNILILGLLMSLENSETFWGFERRLENCILKVFFRKTK